MSKRKGLSKKIRFEVFKRDSFTCQYCGRKAPDVELEVDHIKPVAKGGTNDILNLVTSCYECNRGKRDRTLDDKSVVEKQRTELERLQARNEQLEMLLNWKEGLQNLEDKEIEAVNKLFEKKTGFGFNKHGEKTIKRLISKYGLEETMDCANAAIDNYYDGEEDWEVTFKKVEVIAMTRRKSKEDPSLLYKNRLAKYFRKKFGEYDLARFRNMLNQFKVTEDEEEYIFEVMKETQCIQDVFDVLQEYIYNEEDYADYLRWCEEHGNKTGS